jgi:hypothetical protein
MEGSSFWPLFWGGIAAVVTLGIFSFLYRDNVVYKFIERLWVGITTGYWTMLLFHTSFQDKVVTPIFRHHKFWYILPAVLGILMWFRLSKRYGYLSRYALAFYIGISTGVYIPLTIKASVLYQLHGAVRGIDATWSGLMFVLALIGLVCSLSYFFFAREHRGALAVTSKVGICTLMVGFGAGFGMTVMGRVALLGHRVTFLFDYGSRLARAVF